ncbi:MAG: glycosyltransferase family 39 protein, partial [Cytophagales bacterium]|nr:glycosyltransferase family 39 protein [Cytophagales bacterium]
GRRVFGRDIALTGSLILLCSILLPSLGKIAVTDAILLLFETLAILSLIRMLQHPNLKDAILLFFGLAGGLLVKGPPVLMLVGVTGFVLLILHPNRLRLFDIKLILGVILAFAPILIWGRLAWLKDDGAFITFLTDHYIVNRAKGGTFANQTGPPGYYLGIFILSFLFWLPFLFGGLRDSFSNVWNYWRKKTEFKVAEIDLILFCWCVGGWLLYEPIKSKLPAYALGAYPAIAIIIAKFSLGFSKEKMNAWFKVGLWIQGILTGVVSLAFCIAFYLLLGQETLMYTVVFGLIFLAITGFSLYKFIQNDIYTGFKFAFANAIVFLILGWGVIVSLMEPNRSISKRA